MNIHFKTLGCRLNEAETHQWSRQFKQYGHHITNTVEDADIIVLNSCAVTAEACKKSRQSIRRLKRESPQAKMVVSGCFSTMEPETARSLEADLVVNNSDKDNLADQVIHFFDLEKNKTSTLQHLLPENHKTRAFIKIQDGCRYHCTYCIVTTLRGEERSRPPQDIIGEIQHLEKSGIQEIVLTGVHTCGYGHDINTNLSALLRNILSQTQIPRIRLGSLEPWDLPEDFFKLFENVRLMPHLHLPLQSGSDHILKRMARRCRIQDFDHIVTQARNAIPDCLITTDIIVGFPGETNEHWQETMDYLQKTAFSHVHAFTYSPRPGTAAEKFSHPVNNDVKKQRMTELNTLMKKLRINLLKSSLKQKTSVLWEQAKQNSSGLWEVQGYTPNFLRVRTYTHTPEQLKNRIVTSWLDSLSNTQDMIQAVPEHHPLFIQKNR